MMPRTSSTDTLTGRSAGRVRGPQKAPRKVPLSLRIQPQILAAFRETGPGWQQRINAALADWLRTHAPSELVVSRGAVQPDVLTEITRPPRADCQGSVNDRAQGEAQCRD
ncbi:MAG: BrnA antitoxin family protein [Cupriavidus necator]